MRPGLKALEIAAVLCANRPTKSEDELVEAVFALAEKIEKKAEGALR